TGRGGRGPASLASCGGGQEHGCRLVGVVEGKRTPVGEGFLGLGEQTAPLGLVRCRRAVARLAGGAPQLAPALALPRRRAGGPGRGGAGGAAGAAGGAPGRTAAAGTLPPAGARRLRPGNWPCAQTRDATDGPGQESWFFAWADMVSSQGVVVCRSRIGGPGR